MKAAKFNALVDSWDSQLLTAAAVLISDAPEEMDDDEAREWAAAEAIKLRLELTTQYVVKFGDDNG